MHHRFRVPRVVNVLVLTLFALPFGLGPAQAIVRNEQSSKNDNLNPSTNASNNTIKLDYLTSDGGAIETVEIVGTFAYIGEGGSLTILDISDPARPTRLSSIATYFPLPLD